MNKNDFYMQMKKNEEYIIWNPENITFSSANYTEIVEDEDLKFVINCDDMTLEIIFSGIILTYMYSEQGTRMMSWSIAQEKYNDKLYFRKNPVYKVENSLLIKWVLIESCGFYSETDLTHYCIVTEQDVVDIISMCEPTYRIISTETQWATKSFNY